MNYFIKRLSAWITGSKTTISTQGTIPEKLTDTQKLFIDWNAERLGVSHKEIRERYFTSWSAIRGGHAGSDYRSFNDLSHKLYQVFFSDTGDEIYTAYQSHSLMHFLRMLSYTEPDWNADDVLVEHLSNYSSVDILDYGCGLAQSSRSLANYLKSKGIVVRLFLVDIPTPRKDFLLWLGEKSGIETTFLEATATTPIPDLPNCDICIVTEFFEHVYEPLQYFERIHSALRKDGLLVTNLSDHKDEFMHVSPNLKVLRNKIRSLPYQVLDENKIFRKTSSEESV